MDEGGNALVLLSLCRQRVPGRDNTKCRCYEVTVVKGGIKIFGVTPEILVSSASHICNAILTVSGKSSDLTVPGMWPLCYAWIGYLQANGSAVNPAI